MHNGKLHLAIPPGHVDARCLTCPADVTIPDGTLKCPHGDHDVEPTSLPRMPKTALVASMPSLPVELVPASEQPVRAERPQQVVARVEPAPKELEPVVLPDAALVWHADTVALHAQLVADETRLVEQLRRTRQTRKLLDVVLGRVMAPDLPPSAVVAEIVPEMASELVADAPHSKTMAAVTEPPAPAEEPTSAGPWRCLNPDCITTDRPHAAKGRCSRCYMYWKAHGTDRPRDLPQRGGIHTHG